MMRGKVKNKNIKYYPLAMRVHNKKVVVVGGGKVAERKVRGLLSCGAKIYLISPDLTPYIRKLKEEKKIFYRKKYTRKVLNNASLVFACTSDSSVNKRIFHEARDLNIPVNVCDNVELCEFISPAVIREKGLVVAITSDGKKPKLSKLFKDVLKKEFNNLWVKLQSN